MKSWERIIENYIEGYNSFDVSKMASDFSDQVVFENIENGKVTMTLNGIEEFKSQAEKAKIYFSKRQQIIKSYKHEIDKTEIEIQYVGILAIDFPDGMKSGQEIKLSGRSVFEFKDEKIVKLTDIS